VCEQAGARSVSDLARSAVQRLIADGNRQREDEELADKMHRLERLIAEVTEQLQILNPGKVRFVGLDDFAEGAAQCSPGAKSAESNRRGGE
jgi:hypothetical protein